MTVSINSAKTVAHGVTPEMHRFNVQTVKYSGRMRGGYDESTVITIDNVGAFGFVEYDDAIRFLRSTEVEEYKGFDESGDETTYKRQGLGLPPGMIVETDTRPRAAAEQPRDVEPAQRGSAVASYESLEGYNPPTLPDTGAANNESSRRLVESNRLPYSAPAATPGPDGGPAENY